jgi:peptidoglycan/LPS O-acetylase OafA/YrhL
VTSTVTVKSETGRKIEFLEAVRGVASFIVVLQHLIAAEYPAFEDFSRQWVDAGRVGVVAFFLVSGYVIPLSLQRQDTRTFLVRRLYRLFPLYWLVLGLMMLWVATTGEGELGGPLVIMANVLMVQGAVGIYTIVPTAWTLGIELIFYGQSLAAKLIGRLDRSVVMGYVWLAGFVAAAIAGRVLERELPWTLPLLLYTASLGHAIHLRDRDGSTAWRGLLVAGVVGVPLFTYLNGGQDATWPPFDYAVSFLLGLGLFFAFYATRQAAHSRVLIWLGAISYAAYLLHPLAYRVMRAVDVPEGIVRVVAAIAVTLVASWLVHRFVEVPFIGVARRLTSRSAGAKAPRH